MFSSARHTPRDPIFERTPVRTQKILQAGLLVGGISMLRMGLATDWPQFGYDAVHSGHNTAETMISAANVSQLAALYASPVSLPAVVDSAPVYQSNVATSGGTRNLLFLLSTNGKIMALDAANGATVWSHQTSGTQPTTASPAIDPDHRFVYSYGLDGKAHKYAIGDGSETITGGWPQSISLKTDVEKAASGFTIASTGATNHLIVVTDGYYGDGGDYQGHLVSIDLASGAQTVFNTLCSNLTTHLGQGGCASVQSGIWGRGGAAFLAATGRVYIATGNGPFDANSGGHDWGDSVLALNADGSGNSDGLPRDSYTPTNYQNLQDSDYDLGSTSPAILPVPSGSSVAHLGLQIGKDAKLRLINLDNMSGAGAPGHVGGELQLLDVPQGGEKMKEQPAVWVNPADGSTWVFVANHAGLSGLQLGLDSGNQPKLATRWNKSGSATSPITANGVLYNAGSCGTGNGECVVARNPLTGDVLWNSPQVSSLHWQSPIVVNGALYMTDGNSKLWKFGFPFADDVFANGFD
jgi:outer membrane protein assembly factor BamB